MSMPSKLNPLELEITKNAIPFVADNTDEAVGDADSALDFSIDDVDESMEGADLSDELIQVFRETSHVRLNNINNYLAVWHANGVTDDTLVGIRREFQVLQESATSTGFDHIARLSEVVVSLLQQADKPLDSSFLNLLEEMHDGLAAELGFIAKVSEDHLKSLISMVQLLLADESATSMATATDALAVATDSGYKPVQENDERDCGGEGADALVDDARATSPALLVDVGIYRFALLMRSVERVMRVPENGMRLIDGQYYIALGEQQIPVINLAEQWGETAMPAENSLRLLVISRRQSGMTIDRMTAFAIDSFQKATEIVVQTPGRQLASVSGAVGVTVLADASIVLILDPAQCVNRSKLQAND